MLLEGRSRLAVLVLVVQTGGGGLSCSSSGETGGSAGGAGSGGASGSGGEPSPMGGAGPSTGGSVPTGGSGGGPSTGGSAQGGMVVTGGTVGAGGASDAGTSGEGGSGGEPEGGAGGDVTSPAPLDCDSDPWDEAAFAAVYDVGPDQEYETPSEVPWEAIGPGTLVRIHARPDPYREKWVINAAGTEEQPVVVRGVPEAGELPRISGEDAITRSELDFWNEERAILKIGGSNAPDNPEPSFVHVECLDIGSARPGIEYTDPGGSSAEYAINAACILVELGQSITLLNNRLHDCGNGLFASYETTDLLVAGNYLYDNGNVGSAYEHNSYTEATNITFEYNQYGPLLDGADGNNLKDRSAGTVIRYNWIEAGNRQLDLVESDHDELVGNPDYATTFVYGNILVEPDGAGNSQILHYGGDGDDESQYRKGTLYFFHNTVVSTRSGNTTLARLSTEEESLLAQNNIIYTTADAGRLAISAGAGTVELVDNWLRQGFVESHDTLTGQVLDSGNLEGDEPGLISEDGQDFLLDPGSPCVGAAGPLAPEASAHPVLFEYVQPQSGRARPDDGAPDIGAREAE